MIFRSSLVSTFKICPQRANYAYGMGLRPKGDMPNIDLYFGKVVHKAVEIVHKSSLDDAVAYLEAAEFPPSRRKTKARAKSLVKIYAATNPVKITETERDFELKIGQHTWIGRLDAVGEFQGDLWVVEHKTTNPRYLTIKPNDQFMSYYGGASTYFHDVKGVFVNNFDVDKIEIYRYPTTFEHQEFDAWLDEIKLVLEYYSRCNTRGVFPRSTEGCFAYYRECPYMTLCKADSSSLAYIMSKCYYVDENAKELSW